MLRFDKKHTVAMPNGHQMPDTSLVISGISSVDPFLLSEYYYQDTNSIAWDEIRNHLLGNDVSAQTPQYAEFLQREKQWGVENKQVSLYLESKDQYNQFFDWIDLYCDLSGVKTLINVQVNQEEIKQEQRIQAAAQWWLLETNELPVQLVLILRIGNSDIEIQEVKYLEDYRWMFKALLDLYCLRSQLRSVMDDAKDKAFLAYCSVMRTLNPDEHPFVDVNNSVYEQMEFPKSFLARKYIEMERREYGRK